MQGQTVVAKAPLVTLVFAWQGDDRPYGRRYASVPAAALVVGEEPEERRGGGPADGHGSRINGVIAPSA